MKARVLFATGYEEVEALTVVDLGRRAGVECLMVSADDLDTVTGARGMEVTMDEKLSEIDDQCDLVVLPGGIPGFRTSRQIQRFRPWSRHRMTEAVMWLLSVRDLQHLAHLACLRTRMQHVIRDVRISSWRSATARSR